MSSPLKRFVCVRKPDCLFCGLFSRRLICCWCFFWGSFFQNRSGNKTPCLLFFIQDIICVYFDCIIGLRLISNKRHLFLQVSAFMRCLIITSSPANCRLFSVFFFSCFDYAIRAISLCLFYFYLFFFIILFYIFNQHLSRKNVYCIYNSKILFDNSS